MWGSLGGQRFDIPMTEMIAMVDGSPVDVEGSYKAQVTSVQQTDDAAEVVLAEEGFWGTVSVHRSCFSIARIGGDWKIVNKTFVHTGGEPPARAPSKAPALRHSRFRLKAAAGQRRWTWASVPWTRLPCRGARTAVSALR